MSGNRRTAPPRPAEAKGQEAISVPAAPPPEPPVVEPVNIPEASVEPLVVLPAQAAWPAAQFAPGDLSRGAASESLCPGLGPGAGRENGPGFGPGERGGPGGPYQAGNGVLAPRLRRKVDPQYSPDAMRAKIQGVVLLSAVVQADGRVTDIRVLRSLDRSFGLDQKAIEAVRRWEFDPGTRFGEPVPVLVNIELELNLR